jgi:hypothetical protein
MRGDVMTYATVGGLRLVDVISSTSVSRPEASPHKFRVSLHTDSLSWQQNISRLPRVYFEKLIVAQLDKKLPALYDTQRFATVFTRARLVHQMNHIQALTPCFLKIHFNITLALRLRRSFGFSDYVLCAFLPVPSVGPSYKTTFIKYPTFCWNQNLLCEFNFCSYRSSSTPVSRVDCGLLGCAPCGLSAGHRLTELTVSISALKMETVCFSKTLVPIYVKVHRFSQNQLTVRDIK